MQSATGVIWWGTPPIGQSSAVPFTSSANSWATAFNASTGLREPSFVPNINSSGAGPWALHGTPDGCLWLGGNITQAAGITQHNITRLCDPANQDTISPSTPTKPVASNLGASSVTLTWGTATDNVGVVGYRLYDDDTEQLVVDVPTTSANLTGLVPGTYNYYVRATDNVGVVGYRTGPTTVVLTGVTSDTIRHHPTVEPCRPDGHRCGSGHGQPVVDGGHRQRRRRRVPHLRQRHQRPGPLGHGYDGIGDRARPR